MEYLSRRRVQRRSDNSEVTSRMARNDTGISSGSRCDDDHTGCIARGSESETQRVLCDRVGAMSNETRRKSARVGGDVRRLAENPTTVHIDVRRFLVSGATIYGARRVFKAADVASIQPHRSLPPVTSRNKITSVRILQPDRLLLSHVLRK